MRTINLHKIGQTIDVDYDAFTPEVKDFVINYGLTQILNDSMSGVKVGRGAEATDDQKAEGRGLVEKRLTALTEGKLRQRVASAKTPADPVAKRALEIAVAKVRASKPFKDWVEKVSPTIKQANEAARVNAERIADQFRDLAQSQIDAENAATAKFKFDEPAEVTA